MSSPLHWKNTSRARTTRLNKYILKNKKTQKIHIKFAGGARTYSEPLLPLLLMETKKNDAHFSISLNSVAKQLVWEIIREIQILQREDTFC